MGKNAAAEIALRVLEVSLSFVVGFLTAYIVFTWQ